MISNVALSNTESAAAQAPAEATEAGDTGVFDALLTLEAQATADAAATAANAQIAGAVNGTDLFAGEFEDADDAGDDTDPAADALAFLAALLPTPRVVITHDVAAGDAAPISSDTQAGAGNTAAIALDNAAEFADALGLDDAGAETSDPQTAAAKAFTSTPAIDTSSWNSLTGPAELFAAATRHSTVARAESAPLTTHVRDPRWADELGNRLASMVRTGETSASLQLAPVDLGPLEVNVTVRDSQATVHFGAANAETRALLEASMPRLREMLAAQGFQLMDSSVSHGFARQTRHESAGTPRFDGETEVQAVAAHPIHISGLLDLYA